MMRLKNRHQGMSAHCDARRKKKELRATATANIVAAIELSNEALVLRIDTIVREEGVDALAVHRAVIKASLQ
jgi:hypothetical protein